MPMTSQQKMTFKDMLRLKVLIRIAYIIRKQTFRLVQKSNGFPYVMYIYPTKALYLKSSSSFRVPSKQNESA